MGKTPITKNGIHALNILTSITRGATPIEKNVIVIDSQGNEYEATYPKRAKGLVKSGRARFVGENKICLACPPDIYLEDNKMSENINTNVEQKTVELTKSEVWAQIIKLQDQLTSLKDTLSALIEVHDTDEMENAVPTKSVINEVVLNKTKVINAIFSEREATLNSLLDFYKIVYNDLYQQEKNARKEKIEIVQNIWYKYLVEMEGWFDEEAMAEAKNYVRSQIDLLVMDIMSDKI